MDADFWEQTQTTFLTPQSDDPLPSVPAELKVLDRWVLWKAETRNGKVTKIPKQVTGVQAKSNDPATWASYAEVCKALKRGDFDGVGFVFSTDGDYAGVDLDNCIDDNGKVRPWAQEIIDRFKTVAYLEISPSGNGIKMWTRAELAPIAKHKVYIDNSTGEAIEAYDSARYFTVTGQGKHTIGEGQEAVDWLVAKYLTKETPPQRNRPPVTDNRDTADIQRLIDKSRQRGKYHALMQGNWEGQGYGSHSEADMGLISLLCFWTQDRRQLDSIFRQSRLYRDKWDIKHRSDSATYGEMTIEKALSECRESYTPRKRKSKRKRGGFYEARAKRRRKYGKQR